MPLCLWNRILESFISVRSGHTILWISRQNFRILKDHLFAITSSNSTLSHFSPCISFGISNLESQFYRQILALSPIYRQICRNIVNFATFVCCQLFNIQYLITVSNFIPSEIYWLVVTSKWPTNRTFGNMWPIPMVFPYSRTVGFKI